MKVFQKTRRARTLRRAAALLSIVALLSNSFIFGVAAGAQAAQKAQAAARLSEEQRIVHVLNRLGFGARLGDVERVRQMGLERYIEAQLNPDKIQDAVVEAKLRNLPTLSMTTSELLAKFPNPGQLIRQLQRRGELPADLAAIAEQRREGQQGRASAAQNGAQMNDDAAAGAAAMAKPSPNEDEPAPRGDDNPERAKYRRAIAAYMRENGLERPQRIMQELQSSRILRAAYSERQLQEVMVDFWSNHFNVFAQKGADRWFLTSYDRDVIRPNALGNFRALLEETAKSPAMLFYLDNFQSVSPDARAGRRGLLRRMLGNDSETGGLMGGERRRMNRRNRRMNRNREATAQGGGDTAMQMPQDAEQQMKRAQPKRPRRGINENYARELMELHTLGVEGGYTQKDVQEVARAFTGWTIRDPRGYAGSGEGGQFVFNARAHDDGEKTVLGQKIPAGGGIKDGQMVLDILVRHPSTAKFVTSKLIRRFVADNSSPALVERVASAFSKSGGDIKTTLRAIFTSPEFNSIEARRAKIKTPFEYAVSAIRTLGAETDARPALHQWVARMGEPLYLYQAPTGYPDTAEHWVNTGALLERLNFALALVSNRIPGTRVDLARFAGDAATSSSAVKQERVVDAFLGLVLEGDISPRSRAVLMKQLSDQSNAPVIATSPDEATTMTTGDGGGRRAARRERREEAATVGNPEVARIAALVIGSPEFQRQ
ncbi:MAG TPA: DUF1800 domain-containing protein [Pyrinomonadaceae bacterium]|nr:DUF1800 domain-containing protein [Pyrinomonadaceae bacterium]